MNKRTLYKQFRKYETNLSNNSVSPNSSINSDNIKNLKEKWKIQTNSPISSDPIVYFGKVYFTDWEGNAYCVDKSTGDLIWKINVYLPPTPQNCKLDKISFPKYIKQNYEQNLSDICIPYLWAGFAGTGVIVGNVWYIASMGGKQGAPLLNEAPGNLYAIDITSHRVVWATKITDYKLGCGLAKLIVYDNIVYVGICGLDEAVAGIYEELNLEFKPETVGGVVAFDCITGKQIWETKTVGLLEGDNLDAKGAGVWGSFGICPICNMIYFGTGNNYGEPSSKSSDAIIALDCKTGKLIWQNQVVQGDTWLPGDEKHPDDDFGSGPQVFEIMDENKKHLYVVGIGGKDGYYYVFRRKDGKLIWSTKIYTGKDSGSGIRGNAAVGNGYVYVWSNNGWDEDDLAEDREFSLTVACLDANKGNIVWKQIQNSTGAVGAGVLCNDVFIVGDMMGNLVGYKGDTGEIIWKSKVDNASVASSIIGNDNSIYVGVGVPKIYGGLPNKGIYAYSID